VTTKKELREQRKRLLHERRHGAFRIEQYTGDRLMARRAIHFNDFDQAWDYGCEFIRAARGRRATIEYVVHPTDGPVEIIRRRRVPPRR
jgi:hypothetical protein